MVSKHDLRWQLAGPFTEHVIGGALLHDSLRLDLISSRRPSNIKWWLPSSNAITVSCRTLQTPKQETRGPAHMISGDRTIQIEVLPQGQQSCGQLGLKLLPDGGSIQYGLFKSTAF